MQKLNMRFADEQKEFVVKRKVAILMALLALCLAVPVGAQDWVKIDESDEAGVVYLNRKSVENQRDYVTGWVMAELSATFKSTPVMRAMSLLYGREPSYMMMLYGAMKGSRQTRTFQVNYYDSNRTLMNSQSGSGEWQYCAPGTIGELVWEALMDAAGIRY